MAQHLLTKQVQINLFFLFGNLTFAIVKHGAAYHEAQVQIESRLGVGFPVQEGIPTVFLIEYLCRITAGITIIQKLSCNPGFNARIRKTSDTR